MTLTSQQLTEEVQNLIDTSGACYIDEATHLLALGGIDAMRQRCITLTMHPKTPPLKLFVFQLALACAVYPSVRFSKPDSEALASPVTDTPTEN